MVNEFYFKSSTGKKLYAKRWINENISDYKGIIQIIHGMQEHINRYNEFAEFLAEKGYIVYGHDQLGHGNSKTDKDEGFFDKKDGYLRLVDDVHILQKQIRQEYPSLPYIMLGHSMGSLILRIYLTIYDDNIDKAILMGTSGREKNLRSGLILAKLIKIFRGEKYKSKKLYELVQGSFNKQFKNANNNLEWITSNIEKQGEYKNDSKCGIRFTTSAYVDLLKMNIYLNIKDNIAKTKNIPLLFISGDYDPVGENGEGIYRVYNKLRKEGKTQVYVKLYRDARHEILNEPVKLDVYYYIIDWIDGKI